MMTSAWWPWSNTAATTAATTNDDEIVYVRSPQNAHDDKSQVVFLATRELAAGVDPAPLSSELAATTGSVGYVIGRVLESNAVARDAAACMTCEEMMFAIASAQTMTADGEPLRKMNVRDVIVSAVREAHANDAVDVSYRELLGLTLSLTHDLWRDDEAPYDKSASAVLFNLCRSLEESESTLGLIYSKVEEDLGEQVGMMDTVANAVAIEAYRVANKIRKKYALKKMAQDRQMELLHVMESTVTMFVTTMRYIDDSVDYDNAMAMALLATSAMWKRHDPKSFCRTAAAMYCASSLIDQASQDWLKTVLNDDYSEYSDPESERKLYAAVRSGVGHVDVPMGTHKHLWIGRNVFEELKDKTFN